MRSFLFLTLLLFAFYGHAQHSFRKLDVNTMSGSGANRFTSFKGKTYFVANDSVHGSELWWTDGQAFGMVADMNPGLASTFNEQQFYHEMLDNNFAVVNDKLFFRAKDATYGTELFEYDGVNPPVMAEPLGPDTFGRFHRLIEMNGLLYFIAKRQGNVAGLYSYNPVARTYTFCVQSNNLNELVAVNGKLAISEGELFVSSRLMIYDPSTEKLDTIATKTNPNGTGLGNLYSYGGSLYFSMSISPTGAALHRYDGNTLWQITNKAPGDAGSGIGRMVGMGNKLYYMATAAGTNLSDLYSYDIATEKITMEQSLASKYGAYDLIVYARQLFFSGDRYNNFEKGIYQYDRTDLKLLPYPGQPYSDIPLWMAESNGKLFFADVEGTSSTSREAFVYVDSTALDVKNVEQAISATVFPNPVQTQATISFTLQQATKLIAQLTDIQGRVVYTSGSQQYPAGQQQIKVPVQQFAPGNYICTIVNETGGILGQAKLVKQ